MIDRFLEGGAHLDRAAMFSTEAQKAAEVDQSWKANPHRSKGGAVTSRDICVRFLQKVAGLEATSALEASHETMEGTQRVT